MNLKDKVVIVTGAGAGIGAAIAFEFAKEGANIVIVGRREAKLLTTAEKCAAFRQQVLIIEADVSKEEDAVRIVQTTVNKFGRIDVLVNNAGICRPASICEGDLLGAYDEVMNTNLRAALHLTTLVTPNLSKTKGNVINISSVLASVASVVEVITYNLSKVALNHFTRCAAFELAPKGIRVNSVSPGPVETDLIENSNVSFDWEAMKNQTALGRLGEPEEIAHLVVFLASDKARSVTGSNYVSDNGYLLKN